MDRDRWEWSRMWTECGQREKAAPRHGSWSERPVSDLHAAPRKCILIVCPSPRVSVCSSGSHSAPGVSRKRSLHNWTHWNLFSFLGSGILRQLQKYWNYTGPSMNGLCCWVPLSESIESAIFPVPQAVPVGCCWLVDFLPGPPPPLGVHAERCSLPFFQPPPSHLGAARAFLSPSPWRSVL